MIEVRVSLRGRHVALVVAIAIVVLGGAGVVEVVRGLAR